MTDPIQQIREECSRQWINWLFLHETAMEDPFQAESEAQAFCHRILELLEGATALVYAEATRPGGDP